jgi:hypothetical protein
MRTRELKSGYLSLCSNLFPNITPSTLLAVGRLKTLRYPKYKLNSVFQQKERIFRALPVHILNSCILITQDMKNAKEKPKNIESMKQIRCRSSVQLVNPVCEEGAC